MRNKYGALIGYTNQLRYLLPHDFAHKCKFFNIPHEYCPALKIHLVNKVKILIPYLMRKSKCDIHVDQFSLNPTSVE